MQELWLAKYNWDDTLPTDTQERWIAFRKQLNALTGISIPRHVSGENPMKIQLHAFSDASERAYGSPVYLRTVYANGRIQIRLLCSKSKVAPTNQITLPRLELCGAVVMVNLVQKLKDVLNTKFDSITYWTDSEIVLSWLQKDAPLKTFVANRVSSIKRKTEKNQWRFISGTQNPADLVSRGVDTDDLKDNDLWWHGPEFLSKPENEWPEQKAALVSVPEEEKAIKTILAVAVSPPSFIGKINHRNCIRTWQRIVAHCIKFATKQTKPKEQLGHFSRDLLKRAMTELVKYAQDAEFREDIDNIRKGYPEKTRFKTMTPILDADGVLRVGGRLQQANLPFEQQHPAILPYHHEVTALIMRDIHLKNMHAGPQALLAATREKYWPIKGKTLAKSVVDLCILCARAKPRLLEQIMGDLPKERVNPAPCFKTTGVDYAGPITIHATGRGNRTIKSYICVFVCFTTKAVHLEVASDLTAKAFQRCLKRFIARRGIPHTVFSDNATNFQASNSQLKELAQQMRSGEFIDAVEDCCNAHHIEWKFIPPRSPHFGGWEAAVKSAKYLLIRTLHNHHLVYDEFITVVAEIEAILNSRPLSALSNDPNDLQPLTPGHFLTGAPLRGITEGNLPNIPHTQQWLKLLQIKSEFWSRWVKEYLCELQYKTKWRVGHPAIQLGTLVTLKDFNLPPLQWKLGRIIELIPGKDGCIRVVRVKTEKGVLTRAIHELAPLPVNTNDEVASSAPIKSQALNADAPEFNWQVPQGNTDHAQVNKKEVMKAVRKTARKQKPKHASLLVTE